MSTILQDAAELKARCNELKLASVYAAPLPPAKRYVGFWREEGNSEWAGYTRVTYATREEAIEAARKSAWACMRPVVAWACEAEDEEAA